MTARIALQFAKGLVDLNQTRVFESGANGSTFTGRAVATTKCGEFDAVTVEVQGSSHYCGSCVFTLEDDDPIKEGFLLR